MRSCIKSPWYIFQPCVLPINLLQVSHILLQPLLLTFLYICSMLQIVIDRVELTILQLSLWLFELLAVWRFIELFLPPFWMPVLRHLQLLVYRGPKVGFSLPLKSFQSKVICQTLSWLWQQLKTWRRKRRKLFEGIWTLILVWFV